MRKAIPAQDPMYIGFASACAALDYKENGAGGWVFVPDNSAGAVWFEFDASGDLVDTDCPAHDDGPAASALADDCREFLESGDLPQWLLEIMP